MLVPYLRSLFLHSTCTSWHDLNRSCISGGGSFQGEWPSWVFCVSLDESHCQQVGEVVWLYDSSSFAFSALRGAFSKGKKLLGVSGVRFWKFLLVTGGAECALIWLSIAYCERKHLGYGVQVISVLSKHFASSGFWAFACSCPGCVEPLPLSWGTGVCFCMTGVEPFASVFEGSFLVWSTALSVFPFLRGSIFCFALV